jgi:hypothetical protein
VQTSDLGYALCGRGWLLKVDSQGNVEWKRTYGEIVPFSAMQTKDGGYVMPGLLNSVSMLIKTNINGNLVWSRALSTPSGNASIEAVLETDDGGYALAGSLGGAIFWLGQTDENGNLQWNQQYPHFGPRQSGTTRFLSIAKTTEGGFILSGEDGGSAWLIKTDSEGKEQWSVNYIGGESSGGFSSVVQLEYGGYVAVGYYNSAALIVKTDSLGNVVWNVTYGGRQPDWAHAVVATDDEGFAVAGSLSDNLWLAKYALNSSPEPNPPDDTSPDKTPLILVIVILVTVAVAGTIVFIFFSRKESGQS